MSIRIVAIVTGALFLVSAVFGIFCRRSFTQYDKLEYYNVGELPGQMVSNFIKIDSEVLKKSNYILKITPLKDTEFDQDCTKQKVRAVKVFKGEEVNAGDEFYVIKSSSEITTDGEIKSVGMNFVNELKSGQDYLAFFDRKLKKGDSSDETFYITPEVTIPPFYSYEERENAIIEIPDDSESTYVPYTDVKDNEFFVTDKSGLDILNSLKKELTDEYQN